MTKKRESEIDFDPVAGAKDSGAGSGAVSSESKAQMAAGLAATGRDLQRATPGSLGVIVLGDVLTIEQAEATHAELGRHLDAESIVIDAGALQRIDAAGLQLLTAFVRAAETRGARFEWRCPTAALWDGARRLGLAAVLRLT